MCSFGNKRRLNEASVLIEVLASVMIISVSLTIIMQSFIGQYRSATLHQEHTKALILLQDKLSQWYAGIPIPSQTSAKEYCERPYEKYFYNSTFTPLHDSQIQNLSRLTLSINWPSGKKDRIIQTQLLISGENVKTTTKSVYYN